MSDITNTTDTTADAAEDTKTRAGKGPSKTDLAVAKVEKDREEAHARVKEVMSIQDTIRSECSTNYQEVRFRFNITLDTDLTYVLPAPQGGKKSDEHFLPTIDGRLYMRGTAIKGMLRSFAFDTIKGIVYDEDEPVVSANEIVYLLKGGRSFQSGSSISVVDQIKHQSYDPMCHVFGSVIQSASIGVFNNMLTTVQMDPATVEGGARRNVSTDVMSQVPADILATNHVIAEARTNKVDLSSNSLLMPLSNTKVIPAGSTLTGDIVLRTVAGRDTITTHQIAVILFALRNMAGKQRYGGFESKGRGEFSYECDVYARETFDVTKSGPLPAYKKLGKITSVNANKANDLEAGTFIIEDDNFSEEAYKMMDGLTNHYRKYKNEVRELYRDAVSQDGETENKDINAIVKHYCDNNLV